MRFGVLGPLEVHDDSGIQVRLSSAKQRQLLTILLSTHGHNASLDRLIDELWQTDPPRSARANLQVYVHRLRRAVGESRIVHNQNGYELIVHKDELDADRFESLAGMAKHAFENGDAEVAIELYREALELWRGEAYAETDIEGARLEAARLAELRLVTLEDRFDVELELGNHNPIVPELRSLISQHPLRERFRGQLMLALYRSGRTSEALDVYRDARQALIEELGLEPGQALRKLEQAILSNDPALTNELPKAERPLRTIVAPAELPGANPRFAGRDADLESLVQWLTTQRIDGLPLVVGINGPGGIGKSALAIQAANAVTSAYPDGQLYVDLYGSTPGIEPLQPRDVLARFLRTLGLADKEIPLDVDEASAKFRSLTAGRRLLIVLDNAAEASQVRVLLPGGASSSVLITSRAILGALDGAVHLQLGGLSDEESIALLIHLAGHERFDDEPDKASEIVRLCGRLPLAVRIAGARLAARPDLTLGVFARRLHDEQVRLDELEFDDLAVRTSCSVSHVGLPPETARLYELLALLELADVGVTVASAVAGRPVAGVRRDLDRLVEAQLLLAMPGDRYGMHDLLRLYAREQAVERIEELERRKAILRVLHYYLATLRRATGIISTVSEERIATGPPDEELTHQGEELEHGTDVAVWVRVERENLVAVAGHCLRLSEAGTHVLAGLACTMAISFKPQGFSIEQVAVNQLLVESTDPGVQPLWRARAHADIAAALNRMDKITESLEHLPKAFAGYRAIGHRRGEALALNLLGNAEVRRQNTDVAIAHFRDAQRIRQELGDRKGESVVLNNLGNAHYRAGHPEEALRFYEQAMNLHRELGDSHSKAIVLGNLGEISQFFGRHEKALTYLEEALQVARKTGAGQTEAAALWHLGEVVHALGRDGEARDRWRESIEQLRALRLISQDQGERLLLEPVPERPELFSAF